jgi:endonuclease YncB( thermonuclease family)
MTRPTYLHSPRSIRTVIGLLTAVFMLAGLFSAEARSEEIHGRVVAVYDGDTLTLLTADKQQVKIRLAEIDTPESRQPWGQRAKQALSDLAYSRDIRVEVETIDRYGRTVGRVFVPHSGGELYVNAELVRTGNAWCYRKYSKDPRIAAYEDEARAAGRGLWSLPEAQRTPPWQWRRARRN